MIIAFRVSTPPGCAAFKGQFQNLISRQDTRSVKVNSRDILRAKMLNL